MKNKILKYYGGQGFGYSQENGKYRVISETSGTKHFSKFSEATKHYNNLAGERAIWDDTAIPELLGAYTYQ